MITGRADQNTRDITLNMLSIGPGLAYYFDTVNIYLSGALVYSRMTAQDHAGYNTDAAALSQTGVGGSFMVGKEWWVSSNWGLGVAGMLQIASMRDAEVDTHWFTTSASLLFSATYN